MPIGFIILPFNKMKTYIFFFLILITGVLHAQELYVFTEPASNMPAKSIGIRLNNYLYPAHSNTELGINNNDVMYRINPELMWGVNKKLMVHFNMYASNMHQNYFRFEGSSMYLKYRFLSIDNNHRHFRLATYIKGSLINNQIQYNELNLSGDNSGAAAGIVATQLLNKLALSFTGGYIKGFNNIKNDFTSVQATNSLNYSLSSGYLFFPFKYKNFNQPNLNFYTEFLGKYNPETHEHFIDFAPALQIIIKSRMRIDIGYTKQLAGNMQRINNQSFILRFEYNIFNAYKSKSN